MRSADQEEIVASIKSSRNYRSVDLETIGELLADEWPKHKSKKDVEKAVRKRLHKIMAPYLGDPNYRAAADELRAAFASGSEQEVRELCKRLLAIHASTRERLPDLDRFYTEIFRVTGKPAVILDVACALNPLTFPWMGLPATTAYYAYDIHEERVHFLNTYFSLQGLPPLARVQDIALHYPEETGHVALFLKELPRFEDNYGVATAVGLLEALRARYLVISFPSVSLHGGRSLEAISRRHLQRLLEGKSWPVTEIGFGSELVFCVDKG